MGGIGESAHHEAHLARHRVGAAAADWIARIQPEAAGVGREVAFPEPRDGVESLGLVEQATEAELKRLALAEDLINLAAPGGADVVAVAVGELDELLVGVEELVADSVRAGLRNRAELRGERSVAHTERNLLACLARREVEAAEPRDLAIQVGIERVVLRAFEDAVRVGIAIRDERP